MFKERPLALVVHQDPTVRAVIRDVFEQNGVVAIGAGNGMETMDVLGRKAVAVLVFDVDTPGLAARDLLNHAGRLEPSPVAVAMITPGDATTATDLIGAGAFDVVDRNHHGADIDGVVARALRQCKLLEEMRELRHTLQTREGYDGLVGRSSCMERLRDQIRRLASTTSAVCFSGPAGSGKELAARTLHSEGEVGSPGPFVVVPCGALADDRWDSRWFGGDSHGQPGGQPVGLLEEASGGAIFLEELTDLDLDLQSRLLSVMDRPANAAVRFLSSTIHDPLQAVSEGRLRPEVQQRLAADILYLTPLTERVEDVPLLARHFLATIGSINDLGPLQLEPDSVEVLERYPWPENVEELRNTMEQAVVVSLDGRVRPRDLPDRIRDYVGEARPLSAPGRPAEARRFREAKKEVVEDFERTYLRDLMERFGGNVTAASQQAGMLRSALQRLLRKYGLKSADFRRQRRSSARPEDTTRSKR